MTTRRLFVVRLGIVVAGVSLVMVGATSLAPWRLRLDSTAPATGRALYEAACAACHGADGRGAPSSLTGLPVPVADFTDCSFATREPNDDWLAVAHDGGPSRGFAAEMPAFGDALTPDELDSVLAYMRTFCTDDAWPRGELNFPRALVTEKAFPEDEAVLTSSVDVENEGVVASKLIYEKRIGARNQIEIVIPVGVREQAPGVWTGARIGDVAIAAKRALYHNVRQGTIASLTGEVIFPTGERRDGFGSGTFILEPFATLGQALPASFFVQLQGGAEIPLNRDRATEEVFLRGAFGRSMSQANFGRTWSPMVEFLSWRALAPDASIHWDLVPQFQVTLNTRQNIMMNVGLRIPMDDPARDAQVVVYLLWDWFDGGLFEGW